MPQKKTSSTKTSFADNLENLPEVAYANTHQWADYLELLCLMDCDGLLSKADVQDRVRPRADDFQEGGEGLPTSTDDEPRGKITDNWDAEIIEWYKHLAYRSQAFGDSYPFLINDARDEISTKSNLDLNQKLYVSLLLSANLGYIGADHHRLTSSFEVLSVEVLKGCLPNGAEVHLFGTSPLLPKRYTGNLWTKINKLASDLKERVIAPETDFTATNVGDGGLDIIGWIPCGDEMNGLLAVFGQSACTPHWVRKQASSAPEAWRRRMTFTATPYNMVFIPYCLRNADGTWHVGSSIQSVLMDRQRMIFLLKNRNAFFNDLPSRKMVDEILAQKAGVV
jgi:hypothetical protein